MKPFRCPDPSHGDEAVALKANNDRVYECIRAHKFWRREEGGAVLLADLISGLKFAAREIEGLDQAAEGRPRLNFMVDVPSVLGRLDFNSLSLTPLQWKLIARVDGSSTLEEVRLMAGLTPGQAEQAIYELEAAGLIEVRRRAGR